MSVWQKSDGATYLPCICTVCNNKTWKWMHKLPGEVTCICGGGFRPTLHVLDATVAIHELAERGAFIAKERKEPDQ